MTDAAPSTIDEQITSVQLTVDHLNNGVLLLHPDGQMLDSTLSSTPTQPVRVLTLGSEFVITQFKDATGFGDGNGVVLKLNTENDLNLQKEKDLVDFTSPSKRPKLSDSTVEDKSAQQLLADIEQSLLQRLECVEKKLEIVTHLCNTVHEKVENVISEVRDVGFTSLALASHNKSQGTIILGTTTTQSGGECSGKTANGRLVVLSSESDYPNGSWLGNPENQEARVRCHIPECELERLNASCSTPEKMALTLLDYLFDRETQACSNISGTGKHGKKQLDPLKIYGIKCHLVHRFNIDDLDWHRIKQNLDSKCRTAFRRKQKGMPLTVKAFRDMPPANYFQPSDANNAAESENALNTAMTATQGEKSKLDGIDNFEVTRDTDSQGMSIGQDLDVLTAIPVALHSAHGRTVSLPVQQVTTGSQVIHTEHGDIEVVHATPEQLAQMQQTHQIQILTGAEVLGEIQEQASSSLLEAHS